MPTATLETPIAPPEERFWKRYSPRGEAPLSISGSLAVHVLIGGALLLGGVYLASLLYKPDHKMPVEVVRLGEPGKPPGNKAAPGLPGVGDPFEDDRPGDPGDPPVGEKPPPRPKLTQVDRDRIIQDFPPEDRD